MEKTLKMDDATAKRLYPEASKEFKEMLELNFGKEFFSQKITDRVKDYKDILNILNVDDSKDVINIVGFDEGESKLVRNFIKKVRIAKVYNEGWLPKRGERRYYVWYDVSSGFDFDDASYVVALASSSSASRLCLKSEELTEDYIKKFKDIDEEFIDLR